MKLCKKSNHKIMQMFKSWNSTNYVNYAVYANCGNETNYANCAINQILQIGQISFSDGRSTVVQVDWTDGIGMDLRVIGPFCLVNFIYTYSGPARVISDNQNQS